MSSKAYTYAAMQDTGSAAMQLTLYVIAEHVNVENGKTYCSVKTLMREAHVKSDRTMRNYLAQLEARGFIKREKRQRDDGGNTSDLIELVGFLRWYASNGGPPLPDGTGQLGDIGGKNYRGVARSTGGTGRQVTGPNEHPSKDLKDPPLPPKGGDRLIEGRKGSGRIRQPARLPAYVSEDALDQVRKLAPGWDRQFLLKKFMAWPGSDNARNKDRAFLAWVPSFTKGKPPP
jgi:hypothetical protein